MAEAAEEIRQKAKRRSLTTDDLLEIFTKPEIHQRFFASQPQERPTNGALFAVHKQSLPVFKNDGYLWAKESHGNRMVGRVKKFECLYACKKGDKNFKRHIYQMIEGEHGDIVLIHYRYDPKNQENWRRGTKIFPVTSGRFNHDNYQLPLAPKTADTGDQNSIQANAQPSDSSFGNVNYENYQLPSPPNTTDSSNQSNIQGNAESADIQWDLMQITDAEFFDIVSPDNYQSSLAPETADPGNQNSIQTNAQPSDSSFGIVNHENYQLPLPPNTIDSSNQSNIQGNAESADIQWDLMQITDAEFFDIVSHDNYQSPVAQETADTGNQNSIQANAQPSDSSFGIVNHENYQSPLPPNTIDSSNQSNIQGNAECADLQQDLMQITGAEFSGSYNFNSSTEGGILHYDSEFENQSIPQDTKNDFFTNLGTANNLPNPATPGSPSGLPELKKHMEPSSEKNKKNLKRPIEILGEYPAKSFGQEHQDHMSFQQSTELQEDRNNCKCSKKQHLVATSCSPPGTVHHNIQGSVASGGGLPFKKVIENDLPPKLGMPVRPCELSESIKNGEQFPELIFPPVDHANYFGDTTKESLSKRLKNMLSPSCPDSNMAKISLEKEKAFEGENGVTVLDEGGAGMIHLAAGLGYDSMIEALIVEAKTDINFSDKNGCTALHWAAYCGRMKTVKFLISKKAAHALPSFPPGSGENTPANLAYVAGHQEIGDYLEEIVELSLTTLEFHFDECIV